MHNRRRLFVASCAALVANAMAFSICTDVMGDYERVFRLTKAQAGEAVSWGAVGGTVVLFAGGALLDFVGVGRAFALALLTHLAGFTTVILAEGFWSLAVGWLLLAVAGGLTQAVINPLAATLYPEKKTQIFNMLHAWWPGGLVIGALVAWGVGWLLARPGAPEALREHGWQVKTACAYVPVALYGVLILGQKFPRTARAGQHGPGAAMFRQALRPMFLVLVFCMLLTASVELGPNRWVGVFVEDIVGIRGVLLLAYTSGLMFLLRTFAGPLVRRVSSMGLLTGSSVLAGAGLLGLSWADGAGTLLLAATVFGAGVCYFWPTMLATTAERFPEGRSFLLAVIGAAGGLFLAYVTVPGMGRLHDHYTLSGLPGPVAEKVVVDGRIDPARVEALPAGEKAAVDAARKAAAAATFRWVAALAGVLVVMFAGIALYDRARKPTPAGP